MTPFQEYAETVAIPFVQREVVRLGYPMPSGQQLREICADLVTKLRADGVTEEWLNDDWWKRMEPIDS